MGGRRISDERPSTMQLIESTSQHLSIRTLTASSPLPLLTSTATSPFDCSLRPAGYPLSPEA